MDDENAQAQRLDRWLWCVRFFKTRSLAADAVKNGRVRLNGVRAKPAKLVKAGDLVEVRHPPFVHEIEVVGVTTARLSAGLAHALYAETGGSIAAREELQRRLRLDKGAGARPWGKLDKKARRARERVKRAFE